MHAGWTSRRLVDFRKPKTFALVSVYPVHDFRRATIWVTISELVSNYSNAVIRQCFDCHQSTARHSNKINLSGCPHINVRCHGSILWNTNNNWREGAGSCPPLTAYVGDRECNICGNIKIVCAEIRN